jgi:hypothetical protein
MLKKRDVKDSNRREGAKADTAKKLGNDGSAGPRQRLTAYRLFPARYGHRSERSRMR